MAVEKETVSFIGAAQRLGISAEAVAELVRDKKLKQSKPGRIELDSVYAYSGLKPGGNQTKEKPRGKKPSVVNIEDAAAYLGVDTAEIKRLVEEGELEIVEGAKGIRGVRESMMKMYKKKIEGREDRVTPNEKQDQNKRGEELETEQAGKQALEDAKDAAGTEDTAGDAEQGTANDETGCDNEPQTDRASDAKETESFDLDAIMEELFPGIRRLDGFTRKAAMAAQRRYTREDMAEAVDIAYMKGRLSVYDSLQSFKRRSR